MNFLCPSMTALPCETVRQPRSAVGVEVPADGIGAVGLQCVKRIYRISLGFTHLLSVLILYMTKNDNVLVRCFVEQQGGDCQQGVEPSTCLVYSLGNKLCRELFLEGFFVLEWIVMLCERHGSGIEPAVDNLRYTVHLFTAFRALNGHCVDVWAMKLDVIRAVVGSFLSALRCCRCSPDGRIHTAIPEAEFPSNGFWISPQS